MFKDFAQVFASEDSLPVKPRPYFNHSVEFKRPYTAEQRMKKVEEVGMNVFFVPSEMVTGCDMLSDSGTSTMTNEQWAALHLGDEAYGSNRGYFRLIESVRDIFGDEYFNEPAIEPTNAFIFHQGRAVENALFTAIGKLGSGLVIPSNGHFDTTEANIEANHIEALNLFSPELLDQKSTSHFKGNMDLDRLEKLLKEKADKVPVVFLTITNNTGGGQPVAFENIKRAVEIAHEYGIPLMLDACRFAENTWFIRKYEKGFENKDIQTIVKEIFALVDGFTISFKKDGLANMGGGLFFRNSGLFMKKYGHLLNAITDDQITKEANPTYGGMSGRDIMALAVGLRTVVTDSYLNSRVMQLQEFGAEMLEAGLPVLNTTGGHAVYLDVNRFFEGTSMKPGDFGGVAFTALLVGLYGHRACELGNFAFGSFNPETKEEKFPEVNFVRFAIPRLRYEKQDLESVVAASKALYDGRDKIPAVDVLYGKELTLRHFKARFEFRG